MGQMTHPTCFNEAIHMEHDQPMGQMTHPAFGDDPQEALMHLASGFFGPDLLPSTVHVEAERVPEPFAGLLVHHEHMTTVLEQYHGAGVVLDVLEDHLIGDVYDRKVLLRTPRTGEVVEVGIARIHFRYTSDAVRDEILRRKAPLGDILIRHDVLRRIEPKWYFRCEPEGPLATAFGRPLRRPVYGRMGVIYCNGAPAIELLEVVTDGRS